jgi:hydroxymethylbilane synthase
LEAALLGGHVDLCVHSLKDLPTTSPEGLTVGAVLPREVPLDALLLPESGGKRPQGTGPDALSAVPLGGTVGTSSLRRAALLKRLRPDIRVTDLRGNVPTRIAKLDAGEYDAIILAGAGLVRLGLSERVSRWLPTSEWLPAPGQGVVAIQTRSDDPAVHGIVQRIHDADSWAAADAERGFLHALDGGCQVPVGALAEVRDGGLLLRGCVLDVDGGAPVVGECEISREDAAAGGATLAAELMARGASDLLRRARERAR